MRRFLRNVSQESDFDRRYNRRPVYDNNSDNAVKCNASKNFNNTVKANNGTQKNNYTQNTVNGNENNCIDNEVTPFLKSVNEYFSKGSLDKAQLILNKAEELYIPANIKAWRHKIQEAKLKIQEENDERKQIKMESLKSDEKEAFDCIEKAKEAIVSRNLVNTDKYLRDALDIITVSDENLSRNMKNNTKQKGKEKNEQYNDKRRKVSNDLEKAMEIEALKFIKKAEQAFFNFNFDEALKLLLISKRISSDEYVDEMIDLIENAKQDGTSEERIEELRNTFSIKVSHTEHDYVFNNLDFEKTFKIVNGFEKAQKLLELIENLYPEKKAKEFFSRIQIATKNQIPSNYSFGKNETTINEINKDEAYKCLTKAKEALREGNIKEALRLSRKSDRMYPNDEAKALNYTISLSDHENVWNYKFLF